MTIKKESIYNKTGYDLKSRNENWETLSTHPQRLEEVESKAEALDSRVSTLITTPLEGAAATQEIVEARQGEKSLTDNLIKMQVSQEHSKSNLEKELVKTKKELQDYKSTMQRININQEATQSVEGRRVVNLPKTAGEGHGQFGMQGLTATNLAKNGDFRDGTSGFTASDSSAKLDIVNGKLQLTGAEDYTIKLVTKKTGKNDLSYAIINFEKMDAFSELRFYTFTNGPNHAFWETSLSGKSYSGIGKLDGSEIQYLVINGTQGKEVVVSSIMLINLTQTFGAGNEPTKEECDVIFANYFEGTQSVNGNVRVKSVGKNLFDKNRAKANKMGYIGTGGEVVQSDLYHNFFAKTDPSLKYSLVNYLSSNTFWFDKTRKESLGLFSSTNGVSPKGAKHIGITVRVGEVNKTQLEEGSTSTSYEPYTESTLYLNAPKLRSLPNGVKDEIVGDTLVKRVGVYVMSNRDVINFSNSDGVKMARILLTDITNKKAWEFTTGPHGGVSLLPYHNMLDLSSQWIDIKNIGSASTTAQKEQLWVSYSSSNSEKWIKEDLIGLNIYYELAEPEIIQLHTSGNLIAHPSGTVYVEDVIADVVTYSDKAVIEQPIHELGQLSVIDFDTGDERNLDVSKVVISTDKLSFTHPELTNGDIVFFEYYYTEESTDGLASIEYFDSRYTIKDSITDKHYKWSISIADGVPKIELEEV